MLGTTARAEQGDIGYIDADNNTLTADQQSLRLMLDDARGDSESAMHLKAIRQHLSGYPADSFHSSDLFRYRKMSGNWLDESDINGSTYMGYEIDRAVYKHRFGQTGIRLGRQPIDWGTGRFWQPLNVFGAFAPTDLDTDFKPGIDALTFDWYPSAFSSLTSVYALAPRASDTIDNSGALYYLRKVGEQSGLSLLAASVIGNDAFGAAFESEWAGMGWRIEGAHYKLEQTDENSTFWIAGIDYQFGNGTLMAAEWHNNSRGATTGAMLAAAQTDQLVIYGLQQHLSRRLLGIAVDKDITPLLRGGYTLLISALEDTDSHMATSVLHQFNLTYSVSNESDLLFSMLFANGRGLGPTGALQSEFGHLPASITMRLRFYF